MTGGLYLLQVGTPEDAVALAARIPAEAVELRPIMEMG